MSAPSPCGSDRHGSGRHRPARRRRRVEQLVGSISRLPLLSIDQFDLNINALLPGESQFRSWLGLPLAAALIASVIRRPIPGDCILLGELDLSRTLRALPEAVIDALVTAMGAHYFVRDSESHFDAAASADKDFVVIEGASHGLTPCTACEATPGQYSNSQRNFFDYVTKWINARF